MMFRRIRGSLGFAWLVRRRPASLRRGCPGLMSWLMRLGWTSWLTFWVDVADLPRTILPEDALAVFLRVFLDIRLPFVAFGGSIIRVFAGLSSQVRVEPNRWANPMASSMATGFMVSQAPDVPPRPLVECAPWAG